MRNGLIGLVSALVFASAITTAGCSSSSSGGGTGGSSGSGGQAGAGTGGSSSSGGQTGAGTGGISSSGGSSGQGGAASSGSSGSGGATGAGGSSAVGGAKDSGGGSGDGGSTGTGGSAGSSGAGGSGTGGNSGTGGGGATTGDASTSGDGAAPDGGPDLPGPLGSADSSVNVQDVALAGEAEVGGSGSCGSDSGCASCSTCGVCGIGGTAGCTTGVGCSCGKCGSATGVVCPSCAETVTWDPNNYLDSTYGPSVSTGSSWPDAYAWEMASWCSGWSVDQSACGGSGSTLEIYTCDRGVRFVWAYGLFNHLVLEAGWTGQTDLGIGIGSTYQQFINAYPSCNTDAGVIGSGLVVVDCGTGMATFTNGQLSVLEVF
jgi:hypothetical protein